MYEGDNFWILKNQFYFKIMIHKCSKYFSKSYKIIYKKRKILKYLNSIFNLNNIWYTLLLFFSTFYRLFGVKKIKNAEF